MCVFEQERRRASHGPGIGKTIANFFKNIGRESKNSGSLSPDDAQRHQATTSTNQLPPINVSSDMPTAKSPRMMLSSGSSTELKPSPSGDGLSSMVIDLQESQTSQGNEHLELCSKSLDELK